MFVILCQPFTFIYPILIIYVTFVCNSAQENPESGSWVELPIKVTDLAKAAGITHLPKRLWNLKKAIIPSSNTSNSLRPELNEAVDDETQPDQVFIDERGNKVDNPLSYACAPLNFLTGGYDPRVVLIWVLWLTFYAVLITVNTLSGVPIEPFLIIGPVLNWDLKADEILVITILRYCPGRVLQATGGRHPAKAKNKFGELVSSTWNLISLSLPDGVYERCTQMNFWFFVFKYRGSPLDVYSTMNLLVLMGAYSLFLLSVFLIPGVKIYLCSRSVKTDIEKYLFKGKNAIERALAFHKFWLNHMNQFFSLCTKTLLTCCHPECILNPLIKAAWANGLEAMCSMHDQGYNMILVFMGVGEICKAGSDIYNQDKDSPGFQALLKACADALIRGNAVRAQNIKDQRRVVDELVIVSAAEPTNSSELNTAVDNAVKTFQFSSSGIRRKKDVQMTVLSQTLSKYPELGSEVVDILCEKLSLVKAEVLQKKADIISAKAASRLENDRLLQRANNNDSTLTSTDRDNVAKILQRRQARAASEAARRASDNLLLQRANDKDAILTSDERERIVEVRRQIKAKAVSEAARRDRDNLLLQRANNEDSTFNSDERERVDELLRQKTARAKREAQAKKERDAAKAVRMWRQGFTNAGYERHDIAVKSGSLRIGLYKCAHNMLRVDHLKDESQLEGKVSVNDIIFRMDDVYVVNTDPSELRSVIPDMTNIKKIEIWRKV